MTDSDIKLSLSRVIQRRIEQLFEQWSDMQLLQLSTTDGFAMFSLSRGESPPESDKVAAIASSLFGLSNTASKNILNDSLQVSIVETRSGNILFLRTRYNQTDTVLTVAANKDMSLAKVRYHAIQISELIEESHS